VTKTTNRPHDAPESRVPDVPLLNEAHSRHPAISRHSKNSSQTTTAKDIAFEVRNFEKFLENFPEKRRKIQTSFVLFSDLCRSTGLRQ
jgi:hypothetical protein